MKRFLLISSMLVAVAARAEEGMPAKSRATPFDQIREEAQKQYSGEGLSVVATESGAKLTCLFQRLEGEVTETGLRLWSTVEGPAVAAPAGRGPDAVAGGVDPGPEVVGSAGSADRGARGQRALPFSTKAIAIGRCLSVAAPAERGEKEPRPSPTGAATVRTLPEHGIVAVVDGIAQWIRPGLVEEYSVNMDGIRQDFVVQEKPAGAGELCVELALAGAEVEAAPDGARIVLDGSSRRLAYNRLNVTDAEGRELAARMEMVSESRLALVVGDANAAYPIRIDPTFSDDNWSALGAGMNSTVYALAVDGTGNLYAGGGFWMAGGNSANYIAKWNGSAWSALGSGMGSVVSALAVDGSGNLYAGGGFTTAGGVSANCMAKWDGSEWSALGSGLNGGVNARAVDGTGNLYAGGAFTTAGGISANRIAKWDGNAWRALGEGMNGAVNALAVDGTGNLYAGGGFTTAGGSEANYVAKWNGSAWSALGSGMNGNGFSLAVDGTGNLYVGGNFTTAGGVSAYRIAKWDGSAWSALGSGLDAYANALAVDGTGNLYAGGHFWMAGGNSAHYIAKWNGIAWSVLGSGMDNTVFASALDGSGNLYVGGGFTTAGTNVSTYVARGVLGPPNTAPGAPVLQTPTNLPAGNDFTTYGRTLNPRPRLIWSIPADAESNTLHFKVYYDQTEASALVANSSNSQTGFEFYNGTSWGAYPAGGVPSTNTSQRVRFEPQGDLANNTNTNWRVVANDGIVDGDSSVTNRFWVGGRTWTDAALGAGGWIRVAHITELREEANYARACRGLATNAWTDPDLTANATAIRAVHITELRTAIAGLTNVTGETLAPWTDDPIVPNVTAIKTNHVLELRQVLETVN